MLSLDKIKTDYGLSHYKWHANDYSTIIDTLFDLYEKEGVKMAYTMADFQKDYVKKHLDVLPPEEILKHFKPEERLKGLQPEEIEKFLEKIKKNH